MRRLLEYPCDKNIEIGNSRTIDKLNEKGFVEEFFRLSLEEIRKTGNERIHTKYRKVANEEEYREVVDNLSNIYSYLFFRFFLKYRFGSNPRIVSCFSLLPPIIREKTLDALYKEHSDNTVVVEKLVIAKYKAYDISMARNWLDENKAYLSTIYPEVDKAFIDRVAEKIGYQNAIVLYGERFYKNLYDLLCEKLDLLDSALGENRLYTGFESGKPFFEKYGIIPGDSEDILEFNDLMEFVFIGRRGDVKDISLISPKDYIINQ